MSVSTWTVVLQRLAADATLYGLLSGTATDPKVYPQTAEQDAVVPYITVAGSTSLTRENVRDDIVEVKMCSPDMSVIEAVKGRVLDLLDLENGATVLTDADNYVYYCRLDSAVQYTDDATQDFYEVLSFRIVYNRR